MKDIIQRLQDVAEREYAEILQDDGRLLCGCGRIFDEREGAVISANPYAMPVCGACFEEWREAIKES